MLIVADRDEINKLLRGHAIKPGDRVIEIEKSEEPVEIHIAHEICTAKFVQVFDTDANGKLVPIGRQW